VRQWVQRLTRRCGSQALDPCRKRVSGSDVNLDNVNVVVRDLPHMSLTQGEVIARFLQEQDLKKVLELGFRYGVSTCYMAQTLKLLGRGSITTIDLEYTKSLEPNIETSLAALGLNEIVTIHYEPTSYIWRLMKYIEAHNEPIFDFCYIDGAHNWFVDGFAFFLVDKLLCPGGWILFDDLDWTYSTSPSMKESEVVRRMPEEEKTTPQVRKVYELLVKPHPSYEDFSIDGDWAFAKKKL
jgi:predicted O-methyltransferase YrrM